ncbi:MAG: hypothetical protein OEY23_10035, partial [Acidimicrobiia bacterium]|nr:hypothetical protein [Acidimicrobiia bacterium]
ASGDVAGGDAAGTAGARLAAGAGLVTGADGADWAMVLGVASGIGAAAGDATGAAARSAGSDATGTVELGGADDATARTLGGLGANAAVLGGAAAELEGVPAVFELRVAAEILVASCSETDGESPLACVVGDAGRHTTWAGAAGRYSSHTIHPANIPSAASAAMIATGTTPRMPPRSSPSSAIVCVI